MGVYHLMGLGTSIGAITGPMSFLLHRYHRWNDNDQNFFGLSGEARHRQEGTSNKGGIQGLIFFSTPEVLSGQLKIRSFIDNRAASSQGKELNGGEAKPLLRKYLRQIAQEYKFQRPELSIFWCEVERRNLRSTYERVIQIVNALESAGGQGKEKWTNLTGGTNVINYALQLGASLSGAVARQYYVQAEDDRAEKCIRYSSEDGYWVEILTMPLALSRITKAMLDVMEKIEGEPISGKDLYSFLLNDSQYWNVVQGISYDLFHHGYLSPMWKQGLIQEVDEQHKYVIGPQWNVIRPYQEILQTTQERQINIEELAKNSDWLETEKLDLTTTP